MASEPSAIRFGFLRVNWVIEFDHGKIVPIPEFEKVAKSVQKQIHQDGHLYPPTSKKVRTDLSGKNQRTIPKTKRPAFLHPVPPSHEMVIMPPTAEADIRKGSAGFVLHFLGFLFGTRLQFANWFFDGRIPITSQQGSGKLVWNSSDVRQFLDLGYGVWCKWPEEEKKRFTNILYMHGRARSYEWEWEQFIIQYMVLDACWKMGEKLYGLCAKSHGNRVVALCKGLSVELSNDFIDVKQMVKLRNDLLHETFWFEGRPGGSRDRPPYYFPIRMGLLNEQLIFALLERSLKPKQ